MMVLKRFFQSLFRSPIPSLSIPFENHTASAVQVLPNVSPHQALSALRLPPYRGVIVMHGGAGGMDDTVVKTVSHFLIAGLAPFAQQHPLLIFDGGTASGAMAAMGEARRAVKGTYPLVGVSPTGTVSYPGGPAPDDNHYPLDSGHSHFILVEGSDFGIESDLLVSLLRAAGQPGLALIINGGEIVFKEVQSHIRQGNTIVTVKGSGRVADDLADPTSERRAMLPPHAHIEVIDMNDPAGLTALLARLLR
ncbi:MAG TPA: hypothetical protein VHP83_20330 [Aggregatilineaceae bacterium]|nr:hypothetical protein [Aggregatilineaceae bacterium]